MRKPSRTVLTILLALSLMISSASIAVASPKHRPNRAKAVYAKVVCTGSLVRNLASIAETSPAAVNAIRREGRSLESVAASLGVDPAAVVAMTQKRLIARLQSLVSKGRCSESRAETLIRKSTNRLQRLMTRVPAGVCQPPAVPPTATVDPAAARW